MVCPNEYDPTPTSVYYRDCETLYHLIWLCNVVLYSVSDPDRRLQALWVACDGLPKNHKANFRYLVKFLAKLAQDSEVNKMTPSNIAIVLGPNLLWSKTEG
uniref:Rho-GAP domain-containing protein n=1 Tax=Hucho hucho TaxID=62062 RepID=A0A4W5LFR2_9TELE